jgi:alkylation response protein AidB-like acyl-CoA dehydrogenase
MDLEFSKKQLMVRKNIRKFSRKVLGEWDHILDRESRPLPFDIVRLMGALNIWGIQAPIEIGGADLDTVSYSIIIEEISRVCASTGLGVTVHNSVCLAPILKFGTDEQIKRYAPYLATGKKIGGFTITEPQAGSDAASIRTYAVKDGKNYIVNGQKAFVTNGGTGRIFLVGAQYDDGSGQKQMAIFIMDKSMPGFETGKIEDLMGMRGNMVSELSFHDVKVPQENLLGGTCNGFPIAMQALDIGRIGIASQALGIGMAAYEAAAKYASERKQFNRPIGKFQAVAFKLADMKIELEAARMLIYKACFLKDAGRSFTTESAMCKAYAPAVAMRTCKEALQIFGGYGYVKELPVERYFRDAKITEIYEGTSEIMKIIIGNSVLKEFTEKY